MPARRRRPRLTPRDEEIAGLRAAIEQLTGGRVIVERGGNVTRVRIEEPHFNANGLVVELGTVGLELDALRILYGVLEERCA